MKRDKKNGMIFLFLQSRSECWKLFHVVTNNRFLMKFAEYFFSLHFWKWIAIEISHSCRYTAYKHVVKGNHVQVEVEMRGWDFTPWSASSVDSVFCCLQIRFSVKLFRPLFFWPFFCRFFSFSSSEAWRVTWWLRDWMNRSLTNEWRKKRKERKDFGIITLAPVVLEGSSNNL